MIDEAGKVATFGCVYNGIVIHTEHVATADAFFLVALLSHICNNLQMETRQLQTDWPTSRDAESWVWLHAHLSDILADIFDNHLISSNRFHGEQSPVMNVTSTEPDFLFTELWRSCDSLDFGSNTDW